MLNCLYIFSAVLIVTYVRMYVADIKVYVYVFR